MASEVAFGMGTDGLPPVVLTLEGGRRIALRGVIDRIDRYEGDSGLYLRIIDYKSSMHTLDPVRMWYGLQLQLMLYLHAATQHIPGAMPAGAFYFTVRDPIIDQADDLRAAAEQAIAKALQLKGVVLADAEVVAAMDTDIPGYSIGKVFNQDGSIAARAQAVDLNGMQELISHAQVTAAHLADEIRKGDISVSPAAIGQWNECAWCEYAAVCKRDARLPGSEFRELVMPENTQTATNAEKRM
jgi:ATP-dependent helicase/nuclease subunit B